MLHLLFPQIEKFFSFQYFVHQRIAAWWAEVDVGGDALLGNIHVLMLMMLLLVVVVDRWWWNEGDLA